MTDFLGNELAAEGADAMAFFPVWRRISLQLFIVALISGAIVVAVAVFGLQPGREFERVGGLALVATPPLLWLALSVLPEYQYARPRRRLIGVAVVSALSASAIGLPVVEEFFRVDQWLPLQSAAQRMLGYGLTAGLVDTGIKFVVLRYLVYPQALRVRGDAIAYAFASAIGYSFFLSLAVVLRLEPTLGFAALYVLGNLVVQLASVLFVALGIIESYFSDAFPLILPANLLIAAFSSGIVTSLTAGVMSGPMSTAGSSARPLFALAILLVSMILALALVYFLYSNSERREREAYLGSEVSDGI